MIQKILILRKGLGNLKCDCRNKQSTQSSKEKIEYCPESRIKIKMKNGKEFKNQKTYVANSNSSKNRERKLYQ
jgi:hypothetical protein